MAITLTITNLHGQTLASYALGDTLLTIRAENQVQYLLADERGLAPDAMASRAGDDLLVHIEGDAALRIEDYFLGDDSGLANPLLGQNASGQYVAYPISETLSAEHLLAGEIAGASGGISPVAALAAVGGVALAGAAIAGSGKGGNAADIQQEQPQTPFDPNQPPPADNGNITPPPAGGGNPNPPPSGGGNITPPPVNPPPTPAPNNAPAGEVKIAGEAEVGKTLSASHTLKDDDGLGQITYKWFANGQEVGQGATYQIQPQDKGKTISVKAEYTDGKGHAESVESAATAPIAEPVPPTPAPNNPPTGEVQINGTPEVGKTLSASHTLKDDDGLGQITYKWFANGQEVGQGATYTLQPSDKGKTLSVKAEYTDGKGHAESVESAATAPIAEPADTTPPVLTISVAKSDLTAGESTLVTFKLSEAVQNFESNDVVVKNGSLSGFTKVDDTTYTATFTADKGGQASLSVAPGTFSDLAWNQNDKAAELALTIKDAPQQPNNAPTGEVQINGTPEVGKTLSASNTLKDPDGLGKITYKWFANGTEVGQGDTYTIQPADKGKTLSVKAEYTDGKGNDESVESAATAPIAEPADTTPPVLTISVAKSDLTAGESTLVTFKLSEAVQNFESNDVVVKNGSLSGFTKVDDTTYTATFTADKGGQASLTVAPGTFSDLAWNQNDKAAELALTIKDLPPPADAPTVSLLGDTEVVEGQSAAYNLVLDKPAQQAITLTVRVAHETSDGSDVQATSYTIVIPAGEDSATLQIPTLDNNSFAHGKTFRVVIDAANGAKIDPQGNSALTAIADNDPPPPPQLEHGSEKGSVVITPADGTQALTVYYRDESGAEQTLQTHIDANRKLWVFYDTPPQHIQLDAQSGVLRIGAGALENGSEVRAENASEYNISQSSILSLNDGGNTPDTTAPALTISADKPFLTSKGESAQLTFKLSEPVQNFAADDIQVTNGRIDNFTQINATTYTATYTGVGSGDIWVAAGAFSDLAFNQNGETLLRLPLSAPGNVVINGLPKVGETLSASITDDNGVPGVVQYQWFIGNQPINGATQSTYTIRPEDAGKAISVRVVYQDNEALAEDITSDATAPVQTDAVHVFANIGELMAAPLKADDKAMIVDFNHINDNIEIRYTIVDTLPDAAQGLLNRVAVPLANGKYALPELADHTLPVENSAANIDAMLQVARTYLDAGDKLVWDGKGQTPLYVSGTPQMVKTPDGKDAFAITCSAFINMVMAGWKFEDTTYATNQNTSSYGWGIDFADKPQGDSGPYGANAQLKWMYWKDQVALYNGKSGGEENYRIGDILFFSKQDPEGAGTGGKFFMNVYHSAIYIGDGKVMHSAGTYHGNGVVIESLDNLKADLTWIGRPHLGNSAITIEGKAEAGQTLTAKVTDADGLPADGISYQWYADNRPIDGATAQTYRLTAADSGKAITVRAKFTDATNYIEAPTSAAVSAQASAPPIATLEGDTNIDEGGTAHYRIVLDKPASEDTTFTLVLEHGNTRDADLARVQQTLTLKAGQQTLEFAVESIDDNISENPETYTLRLDNAQGATLGTTTSLATTIADNDHGAHNHNGSVNNSQFAGDRAATAPYFIETLDAGTGFGGHLRAYQPGKPLTISYRFAENPVDHEGKTLSGFRQFSAQQKADIRSVLDHLEQHTGLTFSEDPQNGTLGLYLDDLTSEQGGEQWIGYGVYGGDVHFQSRVLSADNAFQNTPRYSFTGDKLTVHHGWTTALHEIGHSLGLNHPFGNADHNLNKAENRDTLTVMSYTAGETIARLDTPSGNRYYTDVPMPQNRLGIYDLAALHYRYGVNPAHNPGNDTYTFKPYNPDTLGNDIYLYDGGGQDTLDASGETLDLHIDLTPGSWNHAGAKTATLALNDDLSPTQGQLFIGYGTQIESAKGGSGNDTLKGNSADNYLFGYDGNDRLEGGAGNDQLEGGRGADILSGGDGADTFRFASPFDGSHDTILDLNLAAGDLLQLEDEIFTALGEGSLAADQLVIGREAQDANDHILYDKASGELAYDPDGNGSAAAILIANIGAGHDLSAQHIIVI